MLDFYRRVNHYSSAILIFLFPFIYLVIMTLSDRSMGSGLILASIICLPLSIVLYFVQSRQLIFDVYRLQPWLTLDEFEKVLTKLSKDQNWKLSTLKDASSGELYFEIVTPANILSWGCLLTVVPFKGGFKFRCINTVDFPLNQVIFSFGHRTHVKESFISELRSLLENSKMEKVDAVNHADDEIG